MKRHVASVHEGKKPFKCDICDYKFSQKTSMKSHVETVHEGKKLFPKASYKTNKMFKKKHEGKKFPL